MFRRLQENRVDVNDGFNRKHSMKNTIVLRVSERIGIGLRFVLEDSGQLCPYSASLGQMPDSSNQYPM